VGTRQPRARCLDEGGPPPIGGAAFTAHGLPGRDRPATRGPAEVGQDTITPITDIAGDESISRKRSSAALL
jgi:hypothetical protein